LIKITRRPTTNCNFLFLNKKISKKVPIAESKNNIGITFKRKDSLVNKSNAKISSLRLLHKLNTNIKPPEIVVAINK
jgi:hypothetical protein